MARPRLVALVALSAVILATDFPSETMPFSELELGMSAPLQHMNLVIQNWTQWLELWNSTFVSPWGDYVLPYSDPPTIDFANSTVVAILKGWESPPSKVEVGVIERTTDGGAVVHVYITYPDPLCGYPGVILPVNVAVLTEKLSGDVEFVERTNVELSGLC